jgi:hypothetical protein
MIWRFSDGTTVELGGNVEGATPFAESIRAGLAKGARVVIRPQPSESVGVNASDPALLEAWLRAELGFWTRARGLRLTLTSPEGVPSLPAAASDPYDPTVIY